MKITFVLPDISLSGGSRVVAIHANELCRRGHHVTIVAGQPSAMSWPARLRSLLRDGRLPRNHRNDATHFEGSRAKLLVMPRGSSCSTFKGIEDADVVIATWWETAEW